MALKTTKNVLYCEVFQGESSTTSVTLLMRVSTFASFIKSLLFLSALYFKDTHILKTLFHKLLQNFVQPK